MQKTYHNRALIVLTAVAIAAGSFLVQAPAESRPCCNRSGGNGCVWCN